MAKRRKTDTTMAKRRKTDTTMAKRRKTDTTMAKRRKTDGQTMIYKALHRKLHVYSKFLIIKKAV
jgi:hypothetical protein